MREMVALRHFATEEPRRELGRLSLGIPAKLSLIDGEERCLLVNLSISGAKITTNQELDCGEAALLKIEGAEIFGSIVLARGGFAGIAFDERTPKSLLLPVKSISTDYDSFASWRAAKRWASGHNSF